MGGTGVGCIVGNELGFSVGATVGRDDPINIIAFILVTRPLVLLTTTGLYSPLLSVFNPEDKTSTLFVVCDIIAAAMPSKVTLIIVS